LPNKFAKSYGAASAARGAAQAASLFVASWSLSTGSFGGYSVIVSALGITAAIDLVVFQVAGYLFSQHEGERSPNLRIKWILKYAMVGTLVVLAIVFIVLASNIKFRGPFRGYAAPFCLILFAISTLPKALLTFWTVQLLAADDQRTAAYAAWVGSAITAAGTVLVAAGGGLAALGASQLASMSLASYVAFLGWRKIPSVRLSEHLARGLLGSASVFSLSSTAFMQLDRIIVALLLDPRSSAIYQVVTALSGITSEAARLSTSADSLKISANSTQDTGPLAQLQRKASAISLLTAMGGLTLFFLVSIATNRQGYSGASFLSVSLCFGGYALGSMHSPATMILIRSGELKDLALNQLHVSLVSLTAISLGSIYWGVEGALAGNIWAALAFVRSRKVAAAINGDGWGFVRASYFGSFVKWQRGKE
jgi:O-antigen/teichoic acid export membrane protein